MPEVKKLLFGDHDNPSLELERLFGNAAIEWGRDVLDSKGVSPQDGLMTIKALRQSEPRLSLCPAVYLAELLAQHSRP